jgi:hypothetical protein
MSANEIWLPPVYLNPRSQTPRTDEHARPMTTGHGERSEFVPAYFAQQLEIELRAWQAAFGTTQLDHALARLEAAEKKGRA